MEKAWEMYQQKVTKVACVGDSLTEGYQSSGGVKSATSYPAYLQQLLGDRYEVKNFGKTSMTLLRKTEQSYWQTAEYTESMAYDADIVIVMLGTNDTKEAHWNAQQYKADAVELVNRYRALAGQPRVIFAISPYCHQNSGNDITENGIKNLLNPVQRAMIEEQRWETVDMFEKTKHKGDLYHEDKVHFTDAGYRYIAECMYEALQSKKLHGSIVDSNVQYTQEKYGAVRASNVREEALAAWKNDTAVSQISLASGDSRCENVKLEASDFRGEGNIISRDHIALTFIKSVEAYAGIAAYGSPDTPLPEGERQEANEVLYQDARIPMDIGENKIQNVWVSVKVPEDTPAGTYQGTVTASADPLEHPLVFTYTLKVADAKLPDATEFKRGFDLELWQNPYRVAEYYGVDPFSQAHFAILKPHMELYKAAGGHAITTTIVEEAWAGQTYGDTSLKVPSMIKWTKKIDGTWKFDYTCFDKWIEFNKKIIGIGDKIVCYSIAPWTNAVVYHDEKTGQTVKEPLKEGSEAWTGIWMAFLNDLADHLQTKGWFEQAYIGIDERGFSREAFDLIDSIKRGIPYPSKLKSAGAMDHFVEKRELAMRVDDLNVGSIAAKADPAAFEEMRRAREEKRLRTTIYTCTGHIPGNFSLSEPCESYWTMMYSYAVGATGYLRWAYDSWVKDPLRDTTHNAFESGDCFLVFPDEKGAENPVTKSSTRFEKMAEGVRDVNKLIKMGEDVPSLGTEISALMKSVKPQYEAGELYLTTAGKAALAKDMATMKSEIERLTERYVTLKARGAEEGRVQEAAESVSTKLYPNSRIPQYKLPDRYLSDIEKKPGTPRQYLGQPDMVLTGAGRLITAYPVGHGHGVIVMQISDDQGETWTEKTDTPKSWMDCQETPTMYVLNLENGTERILLLSACPGEWGNHTTGWDASYSDDNGDTWTEYEHFYSTFRDGTPNKVIVGMASLIQLKDRDGNAIQKWMGIYHDWNFVNYKTYLTFAEDGRQQWTEPEPYLAAHREIEESHQLCEVGLFRSPDGRRIVGLARSQSHAHLSTMFYSDDEGETWSAPLEMQGSLAGERHKAVYDPMSDRLLVTFREIIYGEKIDDSWMAGDWVAWVGTYEDLMAQREGAYRILLAEDWSQNAKSGDTGYAGIVVLDDGTFIMDAYGHFDRAFSELFAAQGSYDVREDLCYIKQAKFKLEEIERESAPADRGISAMFDNKTDPGDSSWVFTGGEAVQGTFAQIGGARNYIGHVEEYARSEKSQGDDLTRQRYMINTARKGLTLSDIVNNWEKLVTPFKPKAVAYMVGAEDYGQEEGHLDRFKADLQKFIAQSLAAKPDNDGFACIQKPFAVRGSQTNAKIEAYCDAIDEVVAGCQSGDVAHSHIFVVDHFTRTKNNADFQAGKLHADGSLNAAGHLEIGRQFVEAAMQMTDHYPCTQGIRMTQKPQVQPEVYLRVRPNVTASDASLDVAIPEGNATDWKYILYIAGVTISDTVSKNRFTVDGLARGKKYVLKIQSADGKKQLITVKGSISEGNQAVENSQELNENQRRLAAMMDQKDAMTWLFMGDSITHGLVYTYGYTSTVQTFERYLKETLGRASDVVVNTAVSGAATVSTLNNIRERLEKYTPDVAVIMLGTNDAAEIINTTPDEFEQNMRIIIGKIRAINQDAIIVLRCPTPMIGDCEDALFRRPRAIQNMERLKKLVAEDPSLIYVDQYTETNKSLQSYAWLGDEEQIFLGNWMHPGINLHLVMARQLIKACGLWTDDSAISNLYYETPVAKEKSDLIPKLQLAVDQIGVPVVQLRIDSGMQIGSVTIQATRKGETKSYTTTAGDGQAYAILRDLPQGTYQVKVSSYLKDAPKIITFAPAEAVLHT